MDDMTNFQRNLNTGEVEIIGSTHLPQNRIPRAPQPLCGLCRKCMILTDLIQAATPFLVHTAVLQNPLAIEQGNATDSIASGWYPIGSHQINLTLKPGECETLVFVLGYCENDPDDKFEAPNVINKEPARRTA